MKLIDGALLRDASLAVFYPQACVLCSASVESASDGVCCRACWTKAKIFDGSETLCSKCARPLETNAPQDFNNAVKTFCHLCDEHFYDAARAVGIYENALRAAVLNLKHQPFIARNLQNLIGRAIKVSPFNQATKIIPVPLHQNRLHERGFNQAAVIAQVIKRQTKLPVIENCLVRTAYTRQHRAGMDERGRLESVEKSFFVEKPRLVEGEKILLVDDVFTTGATVSACAEVLKKAGAGEVFVFTIARAVMV